MFSCHVLSCHHSTSRQGRHSEEYWRMKGSFGQCGKLTHTIWIDFDQCSMRRLRNGDWNKDWRLKIEGRELYKYYVSLLLGGIYLENKVNNKSISNAYNMSFTQKTRKDVISVCLQNLASMYFPNIEFTIVIQHPSTKSWLWYLQKRSHLLEIFQS